jgi:hypothetical protein
MPNVHIIQVEADALALAIKVQAAGSFETTHEVDGRKITVNRGPGGQFASPGGGGAAPATASSSDYSKVLEAVKAVKADTPEGKALKSRIEEELTAAVTKSESEVLSKLDKAFKGSDLVGKLDDKTPPSQRISQIVQNGKELLEDSAALVSGAMLSTLEFLAEKDTGEDIKDVSDIVDKGKETARTVVTEEKGFLKGQYEGLKKVAERIATAVADYQVARLEANEDSSDEISRLLKQTQEDIDYATGTKVPESLTAPGSDKKPPKKPETITENTGKIPKVLKAPQSQKLVYSDKKKPKAKETQAKAEKKVKSGLELTLEKINRIKDRLSKLNTGDIGKAIDTQISKFLE